MINFVLRKVNENSFMLETEEVVIDLSRNAFSQVNDFVNYFKGCVITTEDEDVCLQGKLNGTIVVLEATAHHKVEKNRCIIPVEYKNYIDQLVPILCEE